MSNIIDLNILFDKPKETVKITSEDGQEFVLQIKVNTEIALAIIKDTKDGVEELESVSNTLSYMIKDQLSKDVNPEWIRKNIDYRILLYISDRLGTEVHEAMGIIKSVNGGGGTKKK